MATTDLSAELTEADYDQLEGMLSRVVGGKIANLETFGRVSDGAGHLA